jgi:ABC-type phosphate/phosphonate transport system substrate-binding protein
LDLPLVEDGIKALLKDAGLHSRDFSLIDVLPRAAVISAVHAGRFDAGVATVNELVRMTNANPEVRLQILHEIPMLGYLWVSTGKLSPVTVQAIQNRMMAAGSTEVLAGLGEALTGVVPASADGFDEVERNLEKSRLFDEP